MSTITLKIYGMSCISCENRIERKLQTTIGITEASVSYTTGVANIRYDESMISIDEILSIINHLDYKVVNKEQKADWSKILGVAVILLALYMIMSRFGFLNLFNAFPQAEEGTGYGMLFFIGILTSLHCVAMCGGINLSQCVSKSKTKSDTALTPGLLYNLGRIISYTIVGGIVGALGSVISFSGAMKGIVQLIAGVFMVIMGLKLCTTKVSRF